MPMPTTKELLEKRGAIAKRAKQLTEAAKDRPLTPEERSTFETIEKEVGDLDAEMANAATRARLDAIANIDPDRAPAYNEDRSGDNPFNRLDEFRMANVYKHARRKGGVDGFAGLEGEVHTQLRNDWLSSGNNEGKEGSGFYIPHALPITPGKRSEKRSTDVTGMPGVLQTVTSQTLLDVLRNAMVARQAGARLLTGLVGTFELPYKTLANTARWVGESPSEALTDMESDKLSFTPKTVTASTRITQRLMEQTSVDVEAEGRLDIALAIALATDYAVFHGSGSSNQPLGLFGHTGLTTIALGTNGAAATWAKIVSMKSTRNRANGNLGSPKWITSAAGYGHLESTLKAASTAVFLLEEGKMAGFPVLETNQISELLDKGSSTDLLTALYFGDFSQIIIGMWGAVKLIVDPFKYEPDLKMSIYQTTDIQIRRPEAITRCLDLLY